MGAPHRPPSPRSHRESRPPLVPQWPEVSNLANVSDGELRSMSDRTKTIRTASLVAVVAVIVGSIGPWAETFLVDVAGTKGDGKYTLALAVLCGLLILLSRPGSTWLALGGLLAIASAVVAAADIANISGEKQELFGREVQLVSAGWGIWVAAIASAVLAVCFVALWVDDPDVEGDTASESVE